MLSRYFSTLGRRLVRRPFVEVQIQGGLGNQLFQYAAATELGRRLGAQPLANLDWFERRDPDDPRHYLLPALGLELPRVRSGLRRMASAKLRQTGGDVPLDAFRRVTSSVHLNGYWQSEAFFPAVKSQLAAHLLARSAVNPDGALAAAIRASDTVTVHVRRGDYLRSDRPSPGYRILGVDYYERGLQQLRRDGPVRQIVAFSDDPAACRSLLAPLGLPLQVVVRDDPDATAADDLLHLAQSRRLIIANSTFSWWAAWIATQRGGARVIAPASWFHDPSFAAWSRALTVPGWSEI